MHRMWMASLPMGAEGLEWFWSAVTRLGEAQILLPACAAALCWLVAAPTRGASGGRGAVPDVHPGHASALRWALGLAAATFVTTASKIAFLGFGVGSAALDFTGFSGHSMFAAAVLPMLVAIFCGRAGAFAGALLALLVMVSRVAVDAHSWSEAVGGMLLGAWVAAWALKAYFTPPGSARAPWWLPLLLGAWLVLLPWRAPPPRTHEWVVRLSLWVSGRPQPFTRSWLMMEGRSRS